MNRTHVAALAVVLVSVLFSGSASAQYPSKPIRLIVGFPPGGSADGVSRIVGQGLSQGLGQPVVVDNRPGADSAIGAETTMRAVPDGYTLFFGTSSAMIGAVALRKVPPYDPVADFTAISMIGRATTFLYMHPDVPARTLAEFISYARANPGKLNYGTGNPQALMQTMQLMNLTGINLVQVPYKGEGPNIPDLLAGRVHLSFISAAPVLAHVKDGRLRALAVVLDERSPLAPEVPTVAEAGVPGISVRHFAGLFGPARIPRGAVERLSREANAMLKRPEIREQLVRQGYAVQGSTPEELATRVGDDLALFKRLVRESNIALD